MKPRLPTVPYYAKNTWILAPKNPVPQNKPTEFNAPKNWNKLDIPQWKKQMFALRGKFHDGWKPVKKLDRQQIARLRYTKQAYPQLSLNQLGKEFGISPEAVRRILKSKWRNKEDKELQDE